MVEVAPYQLNNFDIDVLEESYNIPVLVDYWASWCGPCKYLGPIVEKLAKESDGKWKLVKVNTEEHGDLATEWGIKGIPNLKLFYKGQVIAELAGAMEEAQMRFWIEEKLPTKAKSLAVEASNLLAKGQTKKGINLLEKAIEIDENLSDARLSLAKLIVWTQPERVFPLVKSMRHIEEAEELILIADVLVKDTRELSKGNSRKEIVEAIQSMLSFNLEYTLQLLIKAVTLNKSYQNELARKLIIAIFHVLGEGHELTKKYRRTFDMALY